MFGGFFLLNQCGGVILSRIYRDSIVAQGVTELFRLQVIGAKETGSEPPCKLYHLEGMSFLYLRHHSIYLVLATKANVNAFLGYEYLSQLNKVFQAYCGHSYGETDVRNHFTLLYEVLDETMDFGYPQNCAIEILQSYIQLGQKTNIAISSPIGACSLTTHITGAMDWRKEGLWYKKNEVYMDVYESVNLLLSASGTILQQDVQGSIHMNALLSGMPECKIGLNDKLILDNPKSKPSGNNSSQSPNITLSSTSASGQKARLIPSVALEDCTFHRCVRLGKFGTDRVITFIPPDGQFELMRYRISQNINLPFRVTSTVLDSNDVTVSIMADFDQRLFAKNVMVKIPIPKATSRVKLVVPLGKAKYVAEEQAIVWKVKKWIGGVDAVLTGQLEFIHSTRSSISNDNNNNAPIQLEFQIFMFTASGLHVRFLKVFEKSSYIANKWVKYITRGGEYHVKV